LITETIRLAPERVRSSDNIIQYDILSQSVKKCKSFLKISDRKSAKFPGSFSEFLGIFFSPIFTFGLFCGAKCGIIIYYHEIGVLYDIDIPYYMISLYPIMLYDYHL